jgi:four helix bundle protein
MDLVVTIYDVSRHWPSEERFGLTQQARRAAVSIPSNIAEGQGRRSDTEFARFLTIALGSLPELETQMEIAFRLQFIGKDDIDEFSLRSAEIGRLIHGLIRTLRN